MKKRILYLTLCGVLTFGAFSAPAYASSAASYSDPAVIKNIQEELNNAGYNCGTPDGIIGNGTKSAIKQYRIDHQLPDGDFIDQALISSFADPSPSNNIESQEYVAKVNETISGQVGKDEKISNVSLDNKILTVTVDLSNSDPGPLPIENLALARVSSITDSILELSPDYDALWDFIVIDFGELGVVVNEKESIQTNEYDMRYFPSADFVLKNASSIETLGSANVSQNSPASEKNSYSLEFGDLLDANPNGGVDGNTLVIKAKIQPSLTNAMTIQQNYHNIIDLVKNQGAEIFDAIDYWAVADMTDGTEGKVISFLVNKECINGISNDTIAATTLEDYLQDLWILPSLQN